MAADCRDVDATGGHIGAERFEACAHGALEDLGSGGNVTYRLCLSCGTTLLSQGGRIWALRPLAA